MSRMKILKVPIIEKQESPIRPAFPHFPHSPLVRLEKHYFYFNDLVMLLKIKIITYLPINSPNDVAL